MSNKEKNFLSAVIYVHNSGETIGSFLEVIIDILQCNFEHSEIICVNDDSCDHSVEIIHSIASKTKSTSIAVVNMSYFHGLEASMNAGVDLTIGDFVLEFDSTILDFEKNDVMNVYYRALNGFDVVSASPIRKGINISNLFYKLFDQFSNLNYQMRTERFRILSRRVINRINMINKVVPYRKAIYMNSGLRSDIIVYSPTNIYKIRKDKQERGYKSELAIDTLLLFTELGYKIAMFMTVLLMCFSLLMVGYTIIIFVTGIQ